MKYVLLKDCLGQTLAKDILDDNNRLILAKGITLSEKHIKRLSNFKIFYIGIEDSLTDDVNNNEVISEKTINSMIDALSDFDIDKCFDAARTLVDEMVENAGFLDNGYINLRAYDENTYIHSINVAVFSVMLGISLGLSIRRLNNLAVGAMLHDIGKTKIPLEILNKAGKLTDEEMSLMRNHPRYGYEMLKDDVLMPSTIKAVVYQHHENWNGSGYPKGLKEKEIYELASICHICDVYDALVSKRAYKEAFSYEDSLNFLKSKSGIMFSPICLDYFFKYVPVFKVGIEVILNTGERAIVIKNNKGNMMRPVVRLIDTNEDIDLSINNDKWILK